jgi:hypothetical protein
MDLSKEVTGSRRLRGSMERKLGSSVSKESSQTPCRQKPYETFKLRLE